MPEPMTTERLKRLRTLHPPNPKSIERTALAECLDEIERLQRPRLCASCRFYQLGPLQKYMTCTSDDSMVVEPEPEYGCVYWNGKDEVANG